MLKIAPNGKMLVPLRNLWARTTEIVFICFDGSFIFIVGLFSIKSSKRIETVYLYLIVKYDSRFCLLLEATPSKDRVPQTSVIHCN